jgi:hypothetical protein
VVVDVEDSELCSLAAMRAERELERKHHERPV